MRTWAKGTPLAHIITLRQEARLNHIFSGVDDQPPEHIKQQRAETRRRLHDRDDRLFEASRCLEPF